MNQKGSECANIGLRILATGGVYISGGIPPKILPLLLERSTLLESFNSNNSNMAELLARFPLFVVKNPGVGLNGAKVQAISQLNI
jgi:glucokinase